MAALLGRRGASSAAPAGSRRERRDVFVSYAREDAAFVQRLHARLLDSDKTVYVDFHDIPQWSEDWQLELYAQIEAADTIVVVLSPYSVTSPNVAREVGHAVEQRKRLRPVLIEDVDEVAPELARPQWVDFRDERRFEDRFAELLAVLATDVDWVQRHTRFLLAANDWERRNEDRSLLLGRSDLRDAEQWLTQQVDKEPPATELQTRFIVASREAAARRRQIGVLTGVAVLALAVGLTVFALIQRSQAIEQRDQARSRELAARALAALPSDPEAGLRLALESAATARTDQTEGALQQALAASHVRLALDTARERPSPILAAAVSPDGRFAVTGHEDGAAQVWDLADGRRTAELGGQEAAVSTVAISPDGQRAVTASTVDGSDRRDGTARIWDTGTGEQLAALELDAEGIGSASFSPDGRRVVTTTDADSFARTTIWDAESGRPLRRLGVAGEIAVAAWDRDGRRIATIDGGGVDVWDARSGERLATFPAGGDFANELEFSPDGRRLAAGGEVRSWVADLATGERTFLEASDDVSSIAFCPDGSCLLTASSDDTARTWALDGTPRAVLAGHSADVTDAGFSTDGRYVVTASDDSTARVWVAATGAELAVLRGHTGAVTSAAFVPGTTRVLTTGNDGTARVWDPGVVVLAARRDPVDGARFSADGTQVVTASGDGRARVWSADGTLERSVRELVGTPLDDAELSADGRRLLTTGQSIQLWDQEGDLVRTLEDGTGSSLSATISPDSKQVAMDVDSGVLLLDAATGRKVTTLRVGEETATFDPVFSPDGRKVAIAGALTGAHVWDARPGAGAVTLPAEPGEVDLVVFSPDGKQLATAAPSSSQVRLWDLASRRAATLERGGARDVVFSPDGRLVATVAEREVRIRDAATLARVTILRHENPAAGAAFDPSGRLIVTVSEDATPRLWDARTGRLVRAITGHRERVATARFSPDGRSILTASEDGTAQIHACDECLPYERLIELARSRVTPLTAP